jgi:hypothetical protein
MVEPPREKTARVEGELTAPALAAPLAAHGIIHSERLPNLLMGNPSNFDFFSEWTLTKHAN